MPKKRVFTWPEKLAILEEVTQAQNLGYRGEIVAICKAHGITTNYLTMWRRQIAKRG
jgi:hypothetical protein